MSDESKPKTDFHNFADSSGEVLLVKRIQQGRKTHGGFLWPSGVGTVVECPDWNNRCECGGGLHAWPWGFGIGDGCDYDIIGDIWLVLGAKPEDIVGELERGTKCKAKRVTIRLEGNFKAAMDFVRSGFDGCVAAMAKECGGSSTAASSGDSSTAASSGAYSKAASSGDSSTAASSGAYSKAASSGAYSKAASSGDSSRAASSGGYSKAASSGRSSTAASSGDSSTAASSGDSSTAASSGAYSTAASSGAYSKAASSGYYSTAASSGDSSTAASSGAYSKAASSGDSSTAASSGDSCLCEATGKDTVAAIAGSGRIRVGERGAFALAYFDDNDGWRFLTGKVGENGIKANTWYEIKDGVIAEAK